MNGIGHLFDRGSEGGDEIRVFQKVVGPREGVEKDDIGCVYRPSIIERHNLGCAFILSEQSVA